MKACHVQDVHILYVMCVLDCYNMITLKHIMQYDYLSKYLFRCSVNSADKFILKHNAHNAVFSNFPQLDDIASQKKKSQR